MKLIVTTIIALFVANLAQGADVKIALNWVPEPEFGGIYQAKLDGIFAKHDLNATIQPGGAGAPTWQLVAAGQADFAVSSADELLIARSQGADVVAIFATFQTSPQGIMVHRSRGLNSIQDVFSGGTIAMEIGVPYEKFLQKKFGFNKVKRVPYTGGVDNFLADKNFSQQCFVTSEPLAAQKAGGDPQTFLIADAGYNPYSGIVIVSGQYLQQHDAIVHAMIDSLGDGWRNYVNDPTTANAAMRKINKTMDTETFTSAAAEQATLIGPNASIGAMTLERWKTLADQLLDLKVIDTAVDPRSCFIAAKN